MEKNAFIFFLIFGISMLLEGVWLCFIMKDPRKSFVILRLPGILKMSREDAKKHVRGYFKYIAGTAIVIIVLSLIAYFTYD